MSVRSSIGTIAGFFMACSAATASPQMDPASLDSSECETLRAGIAAEIQEIKGRMSLALDESEMLVIREANKTLVRIKTGEMLAEIEANLNENPDCPMDGLLDKSLRDGLISLGL